MSDQNSKVKPGHTLLSLCCVIMIAVWVWALIPRPPVMSVTFLSVGQGDSAVLRTPSGKTVVIDCGPGPGNRNDFDAGAKVVTPFLMREGVNRIDALVLTHAHEDHIGGAVSVIRNFKIDTVFDPALAHPTGKYKEVLELIEQRGIKYRQIRRGYEIDFHDGVVIEVLNPPDSISSTNDDKELNNTSIVLRVKFGKTAIMFAGDAEESAETRMLGECGDLTSQILKVGHHGSRQATSQEWLEAVQPEIAVISVGWNNQFGHPSKETLKRLESAGAKVFRTDKNGGITAVTNGRRISVSSVRKSR